MSVTGPGCAACSFTGTVPWASEPGMEGAFDVKPCDACGGFSWFRHRDEAVALAPAVSIPAAFAFRLLGVEAERARRFEVRHAHPETSKGAIGGHLRYSFTPTGVGTVARVRCLVCKRARDLTDYDAW